MSKRLRFGNAGLSALMPVWFFFFPFGATAQGASLPADAWWNLLATAEVPVPPPTTVPADAIAVGHTGAAPDKVAAVGISLEAPLGSSVSTLSLTLKETAEPLSNIAPEAAAIVACPVTGPWTPVHNGSWSAVPDYDCELGKAEGKRADDGTWTFDLIGFGRQWLDAEFPLEQAGVLLHIEQASQPVQVSFRDVKTGDFRLEFLAADPAAPEAEEAPVVVGDLPAPAPAEPSAPAAPDAPDADDSPAVLVTQPAQSRQAEAVPDPDILGNLPWGVWLLVPLALGVAAVISYALGPAGQPGSRARQRMGAVSRALSRQDGKAER